MSLSLSAGSPVGVPDGATAHGGVLEWAVRTPEAPAFRANGRTVTYRRLVDRAQAVRTTLLSRGMQPGTVVPVLAARSGELFTVAALGVLMAGGAYAAVDPAWPVARLTGVLDDLGSALLLDATGNGLPPALAEVTEVLALPGATDAAPAPSPAPPAVEVTADAAACVFFTSGSTGRPKGVVVPHRAFLRTFVDGGFAEFGPDTVMPLLAAPYWDAGALEVFGPLLNGGCCVEVDEALLTPDALRRLVRSERITTLWLTSSLLNLITDEDPGAFAGIRHLLTGGERVSAAHLGRLLAEHPRLRLSNGYGPVESMVFVSTHDVSAADLADPAGVPVGSAIRGTVLAVVDQDSALVPFGSEGELLVGGEGLALGYLNRPEEDARRFTRLDLPSGEHLRVYRTGDRVRMDDSGRLSYLGREDRQFKLRGYRVEPGEVERSVALVDGVREAFLVPLRDAAGTVTEAVCAYTAEPGRHLAPKQLRRLSAAALPAHLRPDRFVLLESVPLGATGKADLRGIEALVRPEQGRTGTSASEPGPLAEASPALGEVRELLGLPSLSPGQDLIAEGVTSLQVIRIAARLSRLLDVELSAGDVYRHGSVAGLELLASRLPSREREMKPDRTGREGDLSAGERRFWLAERLAPGAPGHVAVSRIEVTGTVHPDRLGEALTAVVAAHPALRTSYPLRDGRPRRSVTAQPAPQPLLVRAAGPDLEADLAAMLRELAASVHDLAHGPLLAAGLLTGAADRHSLLVAVHHSVYDARSEEILLADLATAYAGEPLAGHRAPKGTADVVRDSHREFWSSRLEGVRPLALPGGRYPTMRGLWTSPPAPAVPLALPERAAHLLRAAAATNRSPALVPLLTAWWRALADWTGQHDVTVGTIVAGREPAEERTVGYFANGLPVRLPGVPGSFGGEPLATVREQLLDALAHAALPTDEIASLAPRPGDGRMPLYQNLLVLQRVTPPVRSGGVTFTPRPAPPLGPQAELCCELWEEGDELSGALHTPAGLIEPSELARLSHLFTTELTNLLEKDLI
ncbi:amino acid adenylation domain-containing protein [Streptomyces sp. NBC_00683]|uniref:amino acid adenylation domain-containing protein n=1 Tax=Streptomyces sp. NBC_00683 TaxID=2903670 RepID=UPI002E326A09|nr:amino acid adenylation domain-containing protein [Streptomyces sp. NBC_00683]